MGGRDHPATRLRSIQDYDISDRDLIETKLGIRRASPRVLRKCKTSNIPTFEVDCVPNRSSSPLLADCKSSMDRKLSRGTFSWTSAIPNEPELP